MTKWEFNRILAKIEDPKKCSFFYQTGNDEYSSRYWQRKTRSWELFIYVYDENLEIKGSILVDQGRTGKRIDTHKEEMIRKYIKWTKQYFKK